MGCVINKLEFNISDCNKNIKMSEPTNAIADTQTQSQYLGIIDLESQPIDDKVVWGRLHTKHVGLQSLDLCNPNFACGRDELNDLVLTLEHLPNPVLTRVSKVHFQIHKDLKDVAGPVYIEDKSRNGTYLNGRRLQGKAILLNNDIISISFAQNKIFVYKDLGPNEAHGLPSEICKNYHIAAKLGSGACGIVRLVYDRFSCQPFAMKHIQKNQLTMINDPQRIMNEVQILKDLKHPCVIKMHNIIDNDASVFINLELMRGGDLLRRIISKKSLGEKLSKLYFLQIVSAVKYLHDHNITHRDLKPENVLLNSMDDQTLVCVSDFGLSKFVHNETVMRTLCGTPLYVAPEVLLTGGRGSYTCKVDIWSLGVVLFTCLSGTLPFSDDYGTPAIEQIKKGKFAFQSSVWRAVSSRAKSLIRKMLTVNPDLRPSIDDVLRNRWLHNDADVVKQAELLMNMSISMPEQENIAIIDAQFLSPAIKRRRIERN